MYYVHVELIFVSYYTKQQGLFCYVLSFVAFIEHEFFLLNICVYFNFYTPTYTCINEKKNELTLEFSSNPEYDTKIENLYLLIKTIIILIKSSIFI